MRALRLTVAVIALGLYRSAEKTLTGKSPDAGRNEVPAVVDTADVQSLKSSVFNPLTTARLIVLACIWFGCHHVHHLRNH